ncbi:permease [Fibrobacterota bacterium]
MDLLTWLYSYFLWAFENTYTKEIAQTFYDFLLQLTPFVLAGIILATALTLYFPVQKIAESIDGRGLPAVITAAFLGSLSPVGTYVLIPLIGSLLRTDKFPLPPLMAFMIASPLINPLLFLLTLGAFGPGMAMMRFMAALVLGIIGGLIAVKLWKPGHEMAEGGQSEKAAGAALKKVSIQMFRHEFFKQAGFILKIFLFSVFIASVISELVPPNLVATVVGGNAYFSVLMSVAAGVPLYSCGGGNIPVMEALHELGMNKGAILAFFISGPATKVSTLAALLACMKRPVFVLYLSTTIGGAFVFGVLYDLL